MAKDNEKALARVYFIDNNLEEDVIADRLNISRKTVDRWIAQGNWRELKLAKQVAPEKLQYDLKELIQMLVDKRIEMEKSPTDYSAKDRAALGDEISKYSKALEASKKDDRPTLTVVVHVIESFMTSLMQHDATVYFKILDWHINWLQQAAEKYK